MILSSGACAISGEPLIAEPKARLPAREEVTFKVKWLGLNVGTIVARIDGIKSVAGRDAYKLVVTAKTNDLLSSIYPVNDRYVSYMDVERLCTLRHEVYRREGRYKKDAVTDFDQTNRKAYFMSLTDGSKKTVDIEPGVQDPVSAAYYFRLIPIELNKKIMIRIYNNEEVYELAGVADKVGPVKIPHMGKREAFHIQPYATLKGELVKKGKASGYFSSDPDRLPLAISVRAPLFTEVIGYLVSERDREA